MRSTFERIIRNSQFDLAQMLNRIDYYHAEGKLTDADREALAAMARGKASDALEIDPKAEILALWDAVHAMQDQLAALSGGAGAGTSGAGGAGEDWPEFVQPTGAHDAYRQGQGVTWQGARYRSLIDNNVWAPDVYPQGWEAV